MHRLLTVSGLHLTRDPYAFGLIRWILKSFMTLSTLYPENYDSKLYQSHAGSVISTVGFTWGKLALLASYWAYNSCVRAGGGNMPRCCSATLKLKPHALQALNNPEPWVLPLTQQQSMVLLRAIYSRIILILQLLLSGGSTKPTPTFKTRNPKPTL